VVTEEILSRLPGCEHLAPIAAAHHERLDGCGYPRGLAAPQLTTPMRLLAVADVYEALTSDRPYRSALSSDAALRVMRADVPERLDAEAFTALERCLAREPAQSAR
jgi:HD-GYP domain-containing protein (c-di-GMP phosphodiesterase class II)